MRIAPAVILTPKQREALKQYARSRSHAARVVERARIVLLAAEGRQNREIAAMLKITEKKAARWRGRFSRPGHGWTGTRCDATGPPGHHRRSHGAVRGAHDHPAKAGTCHALVDTNDGAGRGHQRGYGAPHLARHGLKPHRVRSFKINNDKAFAEKLEDIVGLYLNPPEHAMVLCCRREESDSGTGPHSARPAAEEGPWPVR